MKLGFGASLGGRALGGGNPGFGASPRFWGRGGPAWPFCMEFGAFGFGPLAPGGKRAGPPAPTNKIYPKFRIAFAHNDNKVPRGLLISETPMAALKGWNLFRKSNDKDKSGSLSVFLFHVLWERNTTLRVKSINSIHFVSQTNRNQQANSSSKVHGKSLVISSI